jgi:hypothetical protein
VRHGRGWGRSRRLGATARCTTSPFPCGLSPADSAPAPLLSKLLSSLLSSPLVALLSLLRMKYYGRPSSALLLSPSRPSLLFASSAGGG